MENGQLKTVYHPVESLIFAEYNPRQLTKDQYKSLRDSMERFGLVDPVIINKHPDRENIVIGGHQRLRIAKDMGIEKVPCVELSLDLNQEKELNVRLNRNVGEWDYDALANYFDVGELTEWGFTEDELQFWMDEPTEGLIEDDEIPEVEEAVTQAGDLWLLGEHRVLCGDATKKEDVERLMDGGKVDMVFTDPPYGIGYEYNSHRDEQGSEYLNFCESFWNVLKSFSDIVIITTGWKYKPFWYSKNPYDEMVWFDNTKQSGGRAFHLRKSEPIFIFGKVNEKYKWDTFEIKANRGDGIREVHTCPKPVELLQELIVPQTKTSSNVLDVFLGSGSTLIACEKTNRKCYGMEIDPHYCDVIVKRWEEFTGKEALRMESVRC
jgi:DNA modification methylase